MQRVTVPIISKLPKPRPSGYSVAVSGLVLGAGLAGATAPPTGYLFALAGYAWAVLVWAYIRETRPRYKRKK